jgi:hypothetical protein
LVSPEVFWPDFVQTMATVNGFAGFVDSAAIADADTVKTVSAKTIILSPLPERKRYFLDIVAVSGWLRHRAKYVPYGPRNSLKSLSQNLAC